MLRHEPPTGSDDGITPRSEGRRANSGLVGPVESPGTRSSLRGGSPPGGGGAMVGARPSRARIQDIEFRVVVESRMVAARVV